MTNTRAVIDLARHGVAWRDTAPPDDAARDRRASILWWCVPCALAWAALIWWAL